MNKEQWKKTFTKIMTLYPSWNPDKLVFESWSDELQNYTHDEIIAAIRALGIRDKSPFVPSVFQIIAEIEESKKTNHVSGEEAFQLFLSSYPGHSAPGIKESDLPETAFRALKAIGGQSAIGNSTEESLPFLRRRFVSLYNDFSDDHSKQESRSELKSIEEKKSKELLGKLNIKAFGISK